MSITTGRFGRWPALAFLGAAFAPLAATPRGAPPPLEVTLSPQPDTGAGSRMGVAMRLPVPALAAGAPLLRMPIVLVGTPTAAYAATAIMASDDSGPLKLAQRDDAPGPSGTYRGWVQRVAATRSANISAGV